MSLKTTSVLAASAWIVLSAALPAQRLSPPQAAETPHLTIATSSADGPSPRVMLYLDIAPKPKMHLYAPGEKDGIPVSLAVEPGASFKAGAAVFPAPEKFFFEPLKLTQLVYSKPFRITLPLTIAAGRGSQIAARETQVGGPLQNAEPLTITATFRYQACDDKVCYMPRSVPLTWRVNRQ
jgi:DsbC/DsbD-like thiol-disulfide interchange protein